MKTVEVKNLWNELKRLIGNCRYAPYSHKPDFEEEIEVNGHKLSFFAGLKVDTAGMMIDGDFNNIVDLYDSVGGLKYAWKVLKERAII